MQISIRNISIIVLCIIVIVIAAYFCFYYWSMRNVKEPRYTVISQDQSIQLRHYDPMIVAEVTESGDREKAINAGFRVLADYIFGNNVVPGQLYNQKIAMTAPVIQQRSEKIAMTAPVIQAATAPSQWQVRFVMPTSYTLERLPKPKNARIKIYKQAPYDVVVIRFSGTMGRGNIQNHLEVLNAYIKKHQLRVFGAPIYAFYNPPWTLPFMRRNEIMYILAPE